VLIVNEAEVKALSVEIAMLPSYASSIRENALRFLPASTTAMFMGWPISYAFCSAATMILQASSLVIMAVPPVPCLSASMFP
jgi:hypothetical protein